MKKTLSSKIDTLLNGLIGRLEKLEGAAVKEFPLICKEVVTEAKVENSMIGALSFIGLVVFSGLCAFAGYESCRNDSSVGVGFFAFFMGIGTLVCLIALACSITDLLKLKYAPKLYVIRRLKGLISGEE